MDKCCLICQDKLRRTKQKTSYIQNPSAALGLFSVLGALSRRFEAYRPDQL